MWHFETWLSDGIGSVVLTVVPDALKGPFQAKRFCGSVLRAAGGPHSALGWGTAPAPPRRVPARTPRRAASAAARQPSAVLTPTALHGLGTGCLFLIKFLPIKLRFVLARSAEQILHMVCYAKELKTARSLS